jgi:REP element-mobilizing transposase RayT/DNA-binding CsgD family transcriptional regulator
MPQSARLDIPNLLQHVIVRGIERRDIFGNDDDRRDFIQRFQALLGKMEVECLAWSLMSNHFHLLLRPTCTTLSAFMRRLLTGYAVTFNLRHNRAGHLYQIRYKSLVCDEDSYLLELVRYIHLNPLRAGLVPDLDALDRFPWSGHAVLMGRGSMEGQAVDEVLRYFGKSVSGARRRYGMFISDGVAQGQRRDLVGLGAAVNGHAEASLPCDARILGDAAFVERLRAEGGLKERISAPEPVEAIVARFAAKFEVSPQAVASRSRLPRLLDARAAVCHAAVEAGHSGAEIARCLRMTRSGVFTAKKRGEKLLETISGI